MTSAATSAVIGDGRVGRALLSMLPGRPKMIRRQDKLGASLESLPQGVPIFVATTNAALQAVVAGTPPARRADLVFLQNGMLLPTLRELGLAGNTQALLYMSCSADELAPESYLPRMVEKLLWASTFWLLCEALGGATVGQVARERRPDVEALVQELLPLFQAFLDDQRCALGLDARSVHSVLGMDAAQTAGALCGYSTCISAARPSRQMALDEFAWRNGWLLSRKSTPLHEEWLARAAVPAGLLRPW